jgi:hypothetical protein
VMPFSSILPRVFSNPAIHSLTVVQIKANTKYVSAKPIAISSMVELNMRPPIESGSEFNSRIRARSIMSDHLAPAVSYLARNPMPACGLQARHMKPDALAQEVSPLAQLPFPPPLHSFTLVILAFLSFIQMWPPKSSRVGRRRAPPLAAGVVVDYALPPPATVRSKWNYVWKENCSIHRACTEPPH